MGWIHLYDDIWEHHKTRRLAKILNLSLPQTVGHLVSFWHFILRNAWRDADLAPWGDGGIEEASRWCGNPGDWERGLKEVGFVDGATARNWIKRSGRLVSDRIYAENKKENSISRKSSGKNREFSGKISEKRPLEGEGDKSRGEESRGKESREEETKKSNSLAAPPAPRQRAGPAAPNGKRKIRHKMDDLKLLISQYLELSGRGESDIARDSSSWGRWILEADRLMTALKGRRDLAEECLADRGREWSHLDDWTIAAVERRALDWLSKKQAEANRDIGK